ncbi:hypothetical protein FJY69_05785 [candidate division WOR-3 bacterium]|nr:hypothetical protein [candidate division WOR-3 bacterium]
MSRPQAVGLASLCVLFISLTAGRELVFNGDFELEPRFGWQLDTWGMFSDTGNCRLRWRHDIDPDRDREVMLHKMLHQGMKLSQKLGVATLDLGYSISCRLSSKTERESLFAAACAGLEYLDSRDSAIGETRIYSATRGCPWTSTPTLHLVRAPDSLRWHDYRFNVAEEVSSHLPGVVPDSVRAVRVYLLGFVLDNC